MFTRTSKILTSQQMSIVYLAPALPHWSPRCKIVNNSTVACKPAPIPRSLTHRVGSHHDRAALEILPYKMVPLNCFVLDQTRTMHHIASSSKKRISSSLSEESADRCALFWNRLCRSTPYSKTEYSSPTIVRTSDAFLVLQLRMRSQTSHWCFQRCRFFARK